MTARHRRSDIRTRSGRHRRTSHVRTRIATVATGVVALTGMSCIGVALAHQGHPPQPRVSADTVRPAPAAAQAGKPSPQPVLPASAPVTLTIPAIGVRSRLLHLGQTVKGTMQTPAPGPHYDQAGWYRYSPTPGSIGPSVIAGHVDSAKNGPSVFFRLGGLHPKDTVLVTRADGSVAVFTVDAVRRFAKAGFPTALVYGNSDHAELRLITCGGPFDRNTGNYLDNIVVFASLVRGTAATADAQPASDLRG